MSLSVIIPSKTLTNLVPCIEAVRRNDPGVRIIVVDDGVDIKGLEYAFGPATVTLEGQKPFIYARNMNIGIRAAGADDVLLLNDDALLESPGGFIAMQRVATEHPEVGVLAATCNNVGNLNQRPQSFGLRFDPRAVCFVCVFIPRRTIDLVGLLDESFVAYGYDDDDYCRRVREAGLMMGIYDGCYVDHGSLSSTFRGAPGAPGDIRHNQQLYIQKWGDLN